MKIDYRSIKSWRIIGINKKFVNITSSNNNFLTIHLTPDEFFKSLETPVYFYDIVKYGVNTQYQGIVIPCLKCGGSGLVDWIRKVMSKNISGHDLPEGGLPYKISKGRERRAIALHHNRVPTFQSEKIFIRTPVKPRIREMCNHCNGTGQHIGRLLTVIDEPSPVEVKWRE